MQFDAALQLDGKTATGIRVPDEIVSALGGGNRPRVRVKLAGHSYQTTVARMRGEFKFPVSAAVRERAGLSAGDEVEVTIELDSEPRELTIPAELADALEQRPEAKQAFEELSYTNHKRYVLAVEGAKTPETRQRRIAKALDELKQSAARPEVPR
jgi:bifunctional DNA-binding transcriptional regulator/antitoxin component of YhaV-PrlF toxin-antitoxin module